MAMFKRATREQLKLRLALDGPSGAGKTYTALRFAFGLAEGGRVAVIDTEHRSASKYHGIAPDGQPWEFDVCELQSYAPSTYTAVIQEAGREGFDVVVIDSLSHAWSGTGGALEIVDKKGGNKFTNGWRDVTPMHNEMINAMLASPFHLIVTMRTKTEYVVEIDERGKSVPKRIGTKAVQREGMEYEFDIVGDMDLEHVLKISKSRCPEVDGAIVSCPDLAFLSPIRRWLAIGETPKPQPLGGSMQLSNQTRPASEDQKQQLITLAQKLGMPPDAIKAAIRKRRKMDGMPCEKFADLNEFQAGEMIINMTRKLDSFEEVPF